MKQTFRDILEIPLGEHEHVMAIVISYDDPNPLHTPGDIKLAWDDRNEDEVNDARKAFKRWKKKGYMPCKATINGGRGEILHEFDPAVRTMLFLPPQQGGA